MVQLHPFLNQVHMLPVLAEVTFRVPANEQLKSWVKGRPVGTNHEEDTLKLVQVLQRLFKGIAATFQPHHAAEAVLAVGARDIARYLLKSGGTSRRQGREEPWNRRDVNGSIPWREYQRPRLEELSVAPTSDYEL
mmetsp:Transcript_57125/g.134047  ORF Transcript_57125/g.134047 Transcript_57125/m.134047 type:complete len:135 (-) Transcript_57125:43-447(-)